LVASCGNRKALKSSKYISAGSNKSNENLKHDEKSIMRATYANLWC
jgi:hypothetical protein